MELQAFDVIIRLVSLKKLLAVLLAGSTCVVFVGEFLVLCCVGQSASNDYTPSFYEWLVKFVHQSGWGGGRIAYSFYNCSISLCTHIIACIVAFKLIIS